MCWASKFDYWKSRKKITIYPPQNKNSKKSQDLYFLNQKDSNNQYLQQTDRAQKLKLRIEEMGKIKITATLFAKHISSNNSDISNNNISLLYPEINFNPAFLLPLKTNQEYHLVFRSEEIDGKLNIKADLIEKCRELKK